MVTTNDKIILWWVTNRKHKKTFDYTLVYYPDEKKSRTPPPPKKNDVHTSEDILTKMIKKCNLTLNFFWVAYILFYAYLFILIKYRCFYTTNILPMVYNPFKRWCLQMIAQAELESIVIED